MICLSLPGQSSGARLMLTHTHVPLYIFKSRSTVCVLMNTGEQVYSHGPSWIEPGCGLSYNIYDMSFVLQCIIIFYKNLLLVLGLIQTDYTCNKKEKCTI